MRDLHNHLQAIGSEADRQASTTPIATGTIDRQGYDSVEVFLIFGTLAGDPSTFTVLFQESENANFSSPNTVATTDLLGSIPSPTNANDDTVYKFGYIGSKRYLKVTVTQGGATPGNADVGIIVLGGNKSQQPTG